MYNHTIGAIWIAFMIYWSISAVGVKPAIRKAGKDRWQRLSTHALLALGILTATLFIPTSQWFQAEHMYAEHSRAMGLVGLAMVMPGIGFAVWARIHLGRNWGMPMARKAEPELVTSGPYALTRHPIYTGILLAMLGTAISESVVWLILLMVFGTYFFFSARREEEFMVQQFPDQYPTYKQRTNMFIPYLL